MKALDKLFGSFSELYNDETYKEAERPNLEKLKELEEDAKREIENN